MSFDNDRRSASETNSTGWFVGILVAMALLAIGYLVLAANPTEQQPAVSVIAD